MQILQYLQEYIEKRLRDSESDFMQLNTRKGDQEEQLEDVYTGRLIPRTPGESTNAKGELYNLLPEGEDKEELLHFWNDFHSHFEYTTFDVFYSKRCFCSPSLFCSPLPSISQEDFISLLADRKFLFMEDNEHGNNPDCLPLSELVRNPKRYLQSIELPGEVGAEQEANKMLYESAILVYEQGLVPTHAHKRAYNEMKRNAKAIRAALQQRRDFLQRSSEFLKDGVLQFQPFTIPISPSKDVPAEVDKELSQLFHDFLYAACHKAYRKEYRPLLKDAKATSLTAITCVTQYLKEHSNIPLSKAYVIWLLFTNEITKLASGQLKAFKFKEAKAKSDLQLTSKTPEITKQMVLCKIMLFDYLLKILPPEKNDCEAGVSYAKFQYHILTGYNGYTHFRTGNINPQSLTLDPETNCKYDFNLIPDSNDPTDHLGGTIRHHIQRCISNDIRWLVPGLPNNWNTNSSILATLLLQDSFYFPKARRLTNRMYAFLNTDLLKKVKPQVEEM